MNNIEDNNVLDDSLLISEAVQNSFCSLDFLLAMIEQGKLKAFQIDQNWFTTQDWLAEFKMAMKAEILREIENYDTEAVDHWTVLDQLPPISRPNILLSIQFGGAVLLVLLVLSGAIVSYHSTGQLQAIGQVAKLALRGADQIKIAKVSDEVITEKIYEWLSRSREFIGNRVGRVAGESSKVTD